VTVTISRIQELADDAAERSLAVAHALYEKSATTVPLDWASRMTAFIAAGRIDLFVARSAGEPVGYATLTRGVSTWDAEPYGYLDCLFVAEGHRSSGLGVLLIEAVVARSRELDLGDLQWQTPEWNDGAIRFYERLGATRLAKQRFTLAVG